VWRLNATKRTGDLSGLRQELQRFISEAQSNHYDLSEPLDMYVGELSNILRKHLDVGVEEQ
jgi:hypothetical protein